MPNHKNVFLSEGPRPALVPAPPPKPKPMLNARHVEGLSVPCPKCKGDMHRTVHCKYCDYRGAVVTCTSCDGTGLIPVERATYGVMHCLPCNQLGYRPAPFAALNGTIIDNKFCRRCGTTGKHVLTCSGSVCAACDQRVEG